MEKRLKKCLWTRELARCMFVFFLIEIHLCGNLNGFTCCDSLSGSNIVY